MNAKVKKVSAVNVIHVVTDLLAPQLKPDGHAVVAQIKNYLKTD